MQTGLLKYLYSLKESSIKTRIETPLGILSLKTSNHVSKRVPLKKGGMVNVGLEVPYLLIKFSLNVFGKPLVILLEGIGAEDFHFLRSAIRSSTVSKDFVFPAAIWLSASASAFVQSNALKYGGRGQAYLINSVTASSVFGFLADFLYLSISSMMSSAMVFVISRKTIAISLLHQHTIPKPVKSIYQHRYKSRVVVFMVTKAVISKTTLLKNLPPPLFTKEGDYTHLPPPQEGISLPLVKGG